MSDRLARRHESPEVEAWVVRGGRYGKTVKHNLDKNVVTVGYGDWLTEADAPLFLSATEDDLNRIFEHRFGNEHPARRSRHGPKTILRFRDKIKIGDLVVLPLSNHARKDEWAAIGEVVGPAEFDPGQPEGARLRRCVRWLRTDVPKSSIPDDIQSAITTGHTVSQPGAADAARRIRRVAEQGKADRPALSGDEAGVESGDGHEIPEGAKARVMVNRYERDPEARRLCLEHFGHECRVCGLRFEARYGDIGREFIHVHHKTPLSEITDHNNHKVRPREDLVPVCPNCHAMLHRPPDRTLTVEELRQRMAEARARTE